MRFEALWGLVGSRARLALLSGLKVWRACPSELLCVCGLRFYEGLIGGRIVCRARLTPPSGLKM